MAEFSASRSAAHYIVGVDGSAPATAATEWAARHARDEGAAVLLVHVIDPESGLMAGGLADAAEAEGRALLAAAEARVRESFPDVEVDVEILTGVPAWVLAEHATPLDTLVVGTGKTGYVSGRVLGSRSVQFALAAPGSVAVVPDGDPKFRTGVVAGIDRAETAALIATRAAVEARERNMRLTLVHAVKPEGARGARASTEGPLVLAAEAARAVGDRLEIRSRVSTRPPAEALLDASRGAALLVVGPGATAPHRSPLGSTLHSVLLNANAPVLVVR